MSLGAKLYKEFGWFGRLKRRGVESKKRAIHNQAPTANRSYYDALEITVLQDISVNAPLYGKP